MHRLHRLVEELGLSPLECRSFQRNDFLKWSEPYLWSFPADHAPTISSGLVPV